MGELIKFESAKEHESKVFTQQVMQCLELANAVSRMLKPHNCKVLFAAVDGVRPYLVVEADAPMHAVSYGYLQFQLLRTPGQFSGTAKTRLLQCDILWRIRPDAVSHVIGRVH